MIRVRRYPGRLAAEEAAEWLRIHGIPAEVVGDHVHAAHPLSLAPWAQLQVVVLDNAHLERATGLLEELDATPIEQDVPLERAAWPDLSRLEGVSAPACPGCGAALPMDATLEQCPSCGAGVDVAGLIVAEHGPEALLAGYDDPDAAAGADAGAYAGAGRGVCALCGGMLAGSGERGRCPSCGQLYDGTGSWPAGGKS